SPNGPGVSRLPDFHDPSWVDFFVVTGQDSPMDPISANVQIAAMIRIFNFIGHISPCKTHSGCHAASLQAQSLGVSYQDIAAVGHWIAFQTRMEIHYLASVPITCAMALAGFKDKPFFLARNHCKPSVGFQQQIFGWMEQVYGEEGSEEQARWIQECHEEMNEVDENELEDIEKFKHPQLPSATKTADGQDHQNTDMDMDMDMDNHNNSTPGAKAKKQTTEPVITHELEMIYKQSFLKLLV
ncbi:hypothetical protein BGZ82_004047, partial [Podila clonocystis]